MANVDLEKLSALSPREKKYYDSLMQYRDVIAGNMKNHADALDASNADKRGVTTHMADVGSDSSRHEMELRMMTDEGDVLEMINDAIARIFDHEFGKCQDCGKDISEARLDAKPYAIYCIKCKSIREKHNGRNPFVD
ncbi:MAG: TraR/DksA family transcriptional regulator [Victivallaceae bacterium]|nr:TraR/DksA family transcriptional regulator [Victivallaceae bacterium]